MLKLKITCSILNEKETNGGFISFLCHCKQPMSLANSPVSSGTVGGSCELLFHSPLVLDRFQRSVCGFFFVCLLSRTMSYESFKHKRHPATRVNQCSVRLLQKRSSQPISALIVSADSDGWYFTKSTI